MSKEAAMIAHSPKYPALYVRAANVRFRGGVAEVTEEQAELLAKERYTVGITVDGVPAKEWAKRKRSKRRQQDEGQAEESEQ